MIKILMGKEDFRKLISGKEVELFGLRNVKIVLQNFGYQEIIEMVEEEKTMIPKAPPPSSKSWTRQEIDSIYKKAEDHVAKMNTI